MFSEICPSVLCSQTLSVTLNHWTINLTSKNFEFLLGNKNLFCGRKRFQMQEIILALVLRVFPAWSFCGE